LVFAAGIEFHPYRISTVRKVRPQLHAKKIRALTARSGHADTLFPTPKQALGQSVMMLAGSVPIAHADVANFDHIGFATLPQGV